MKAITNKESPKVLFLMMDFEDEPWSSLFEKGCKETWIREANAKVLRYRGRKTIRSVSKKLNKLQISRFGLKLWPKSHIAYEISKKYSKLVTETDSIIMVDVPDNWWRHGQKFLIALRYCIENFDFEYLIKCNATLYVNTRQLTDFLILEKPMYAGPIEKKKTFASGWGTVLHRDICKMLINSDHKFFAKFFDDEALGLTLGKSGIHVTSMPLLWIKSLDDLRCSDPSLLARYPFIRTKGYDVLGSRIDAQIMIQLHEALKYDQKTKRVRTRR